MKLLVKIKKLPSQILQVTEKTIKRDIAKLKEQNKLSRVGGLKSGYWLIENN